MESTATTACVLLLLYCVLSFVKGVVSSERPVYFEGGFG